MSDEPRIDDASNADVWADTNLPLAPWHHFRGDVRFDSGFHRQDEYFRPWAIRGEDFQGLVQRYENVNILAHVEQNQQQQQQRGRGREENIDQLYQVIEPGIAVIGLQGVLMKHVSSLTRGTSTVMARDQIRRAVADPEIKQILLMIDSPGGTAAGTDELARDVASANKRKPVTAFITDLGASAAYWIASQAGRVFTNRAGMVGSIGTYMVLTDSSGSAAQLGVKVHVIRAGEFKGMGTPGTEITSEQIARAQRIVDALNDLFLRGVAQGRRLTLKQVRELADGDVHVGESALQLGLVDGVRTDDEIIETLRSQGARKVMPTVSETTPKTETTPAAQPKSALEMIQEYKQACPGAPGDFILGQIDAGASVEAASRLWIERQRMELEEVKRERDDLKAERDAQSKAPGIDPVGTGGTQEKPTGDAYRTLNELVDERVSKSRGRKSRQQALSEINREHPELLDQTVQDYNARYPRTRPESRKVG